MTFLFHPAVLSGQSSETPVPSRPNGWQDSSFQSFSGHYHMRTTSDFDIVTSIGHIHSALTSVTAVKPGALNALSDIVK